MATDYYGGQGAPDYNEGEFTVKYYLNTKLWGRREREKRFTHYDKAKAFYDGIDDSAAIWDTTRSAELCEAKTRIAYFAATLQHKKQKSNTREVAVTTSEPHHALVLFHKEAKGTDWSLLKESLRDISEAEYHKLKATAVDE
ncbi:hypothetical protein Q5H93_06300 [Hymenobacter sp. ASUV-10]|uniref:Uncharacterized protein n=1 Tax=Hymenobacter aranciens TaxID=3063996 RepID=A0ABT9B832_9BACT|nr:hypothetical protein [Hymenobacter sp. ASUV-10]MDO7874337.1 hypothetical protein [Hymenobacter sp. ASUV-10]